jgi:iron complex outermembrane receptor protein
VIIVNHRPYLLASTILSLSAICASPSWAQTATPDPAPAPAAASAAQPADAVPEIVVTGSRIAGITNATSSSPIAVATHQDIVLSKSSTVEQVLARIPAVDFNGGYSQSSNNGGDGLSQVSIRNLGPARTAVIANQVITAAMVCHRSASATWVRRGHLY